MEQRSLRVVETNKTFFSRISNSISKILVPTRIGLNNIMISMKRSSVLKAYTNYVEAPKHADEEKKELASQKYEDAYSLYLEVIDKNIMDSLYKKVKNGIANNFEKEALARYYLVVTLKDKNYLEYKYKKQAYLLRIDYETASNNIKKNDLLDTYKSFYVSKMDSLYKGLLKNYSVELTNNIQGDMPKDKLYEKIFTELESYVNDILPIKISLGEENKKYQEEYDKYEEISIGKLNIQEKILKNLVLLGISRKFFTHSLPLAATEKCYVWLIKSIRNLILNENNEVKQKHNFDVLSTIIESYNLEILSTKVYWDDLDEKEQYKKFWDQYNTIRKTEDEEVKKTQKLILFLKADLNMLYKNKKKYKKEIRIYKKYLTQLGGMRKLKDKCNNTKIRYKGEIQKCNMLK